jgi:hypothetical protein
MSALLFRHALANGTWVELVMTEVQLLTPMAVSWWVLSGR